MNSDKIEDVLAHMNLMADLKSQKQWHFRTHSDLWKAVYKSIAYDDKLVVHPKDHLLMAYKGTGRAVSLKDVYLYAKDYSVTPAAEAEVVGMDIQIEYIHEDQNGCDNPDIIRKNITLQPPTDFLNNMFQAEFDEWADKVKAERDAATKAEELKMLAELRRKYPNE